MSDLKIRWIGQSGYLLSDGKNVICIDPYLSDVVNRVANRPRMVKVPVAPEDLCADAVICTHNHLDHVDTDAIPLMKKENMTFYAPADCENTLSELGVKNYAVFDNGMSYEIGDFKIRAVYSDHTVPSVGVIITHGETSMYFTGDTYYNEKLAKNKCDILFVCINGKLGNMDVNEAIKLSEKINPKTAVPNHYGMFESNTEDPQKFDVPNRFIMEFDKEYEVKDKCLI